MKEVVFGFIVGAIFTVICLVPKTPHVQTKTVQVIEYRYIKDTKPHTYKLDFDGGQSITLQEITK